LRFKTNRINVNGRYCAVELWENNPLSDDPFNVVLRVDGKAIGWKEGDDFKFNLSGAGARDLGQMLVEVV